jgi:kynureninase
MSHTLADIQFLDRNDPLAPCRDRFSLPEGVIYLDGNSLGALPRGVKARMDEVVSSQWGEGLIRSWNTHDWIDLPGRVGDRIARLVGAGTGTITVADSTSVNLFKALGAALRLRPGRRIIVSETGNFPTDAYIAAGIAELMGQGHELRLVAADELAAALTADVAVLMVTEVNYRTGARLDMASLTAAAHEAGALTIWDLAHSAGALPVDLTAANADFASAAATNASMAGPAPRLSSTPRPGITLTCGSRSPAGSATPNPSRSLRRIARQRGLTACGSAPHRSCRCRRSTLRSMPSRVSTSRR